MKKILILLFIVLAAGAWVGEKLVQDPGYVLVSYNNTTLETSVWVLLLFSFFAFLIAHWGLNLFFKIGLPTKKFSAWRHNRLNKTAQKRTQKGLVALSEGRWWQAQRLLSQTAEVAAQPMINYLGAAKAAHEQGDNETTDQYIDKARAIAPKAEVTIGLQQADILVDRGDIEQATQILKQLNDYAPKHTQVLRALSNILQRQQDWDALVSLIPSLRKHKALNDEQLNQLEDACYGKMLTNITASLPIESSKEVRLNALNRGWKSLPNKLNKTSSMIETYCEALITAGAHDAAEKFLKEQIKRSWNDSLVAIYGKVRATDSLRQYKQAVFWLKDHPDNAILLLCTARLAAAHKEWQEALRYFEKSIDQQPSVDAYKEFAILLDSLGQHEKSLHMSQKAMVLTGGDTLIFPLPEQPKENDSVTTSSQSA